MLSDSFSLKSGTAILLIVFTLVGIGVIMVYSSSALFAERHWGQPSRFLLFQGAYLLVGVFLLRIASRYPYQHYQKLIPLLMVLAFIVMVLVIIPGIGKKIYGARRWIRFFGVGFQPAELLKITLIFWMAGFLDRKKGVITSFSRGLLPSFIVLGVYLSLLLLQPDFGTTVLVTLTLLLMTFSAGVKPSHILFSLIGTASIGFYLVINSTYRWRRITGFLDPWADPNDSGYQLINSFIAYGSGGIFGMGLGNSQQKQFFLPQAHTDFIFSIIAEETGLIGVCVTLLLFVLFMFKGFQIAQNCQDDFGRNLAFGITTMILLQSLMHIGVVTGLLPTKGIGLPFISYGGTSLVVTLVMVGILVNVANHSNKAPS